MRKIISFYGLLILLLSHNQTTWAIQRYGDTLCRNPDYFCIKVKQKESWEKLFPNPEVRDIIMRVNRLNVRLTPNMILAIPKNLNRLTIYDVAPFPRYIEGIHEKTIYVSQKQLAWAAYSAEGALIWWGPISPGMETCKSSPGGCKTPSGAFRVSQKQDIDCISTTFPRRGEDDNGGAPMPYCMYFFQGYALHGSLEVPGYKASHGCVRLFIEDARWLNEEFIDLPDFDKKGTRVVIDDP